MTLNPKIRRGLAVLALCAAASGHAAPHPSVTVGAPQAIPPFGTPTTLMPASRIDVVYSETQGKATVSVGEPITLGPAPPQKLVVMH